MKFSSSNSQRVYIRFTGGKYRRFIDLSKDQKQDETATTPAIHGSYGQLLLDVRWKTRRQSILERDNNRCVICQSTASLQVHHRQYHFQKSTQQFNAPWDYSDELMITLCEPCHRRGHQQYTVPTITI